MKKFSEFYFGDIQVRYYLDDANHIGMMLVPKGMEDKVVENEHPLEPLVEVHEKGGHLPSGYGNGMTMATTVATGNLKFASQTKEGDTVVTKLSDGAGRDAIHFLKGGEGLQALRSYVTFENNTKETVELDLLSSLNFGEVTPFTDDDASGKLNLCRARSFWSAEGRMDIRPLEDCGLERSWTWHAMRVEKFGQIGSMPVRGFFPFCAIEDTERNVTWAMQLACPSSWQMEIRRKEDRLALMASLADGDYGHWSKKINPGESFTTPEAYVTVGTGNVDLVSQRLLTIHKENMGDRFGHLPVMFNEYCATWGNPSMANLKEIVEAVDGHGMEYLVIDAGWYGKPGIAWHLCGGDWIPNDKELFPGGLEATVKMIKDKGMIPGIWFEPETCSNESDIFKREEMLLTREGKVIDTDNRRFLDMRKQEVKDYLDERVIGLLKKHGFGYIKVDYNDCIGTGCDGAESLGEGLRQNMQESLNFFRRMREQIPGLIIENCASGGHRLEPSLMAVSDMASFSDAHEVNEIPIIAAQLHRLILPAQSQIWAALRKDDSFKRLNYSLVNTFLGVMCISGDVQQLNKEQWEKVDEGIGFYKEVRDIIRDGVSSFYGNLSSSWRHPTGWQGVVRTSGNETLTVIHTFNGSYPEKVTVPVKGSKIKRIMCSEGNKVTLENGMLTVELKADLEAIAIHTAD